MLESRPIILLLHGCALRKDLEQTLGKGYLHPFQLVEMVPDFTLINRLIG